MTHDDPRPAAGRQLDRTRARPMARPRGLPTAARRRDGRPTRADREAPDRKRSPPCAPAAARSPPASILPAVGAASDPRSPAPARNVDRGDRPGVRTGPPERRQLDPRCRARHHAGRSCPEPVNKLHDLVRELSSFMKRKWPRLGTRRIAGLPGQGRASSPMGLGGVVRFGSFRLTPPPPARAASGSRLKNSSLSRRWKGGSNRRAIEPAIANETRHNSPLR
jgi:hypothetical protein